MWLSGPEGAQRGHLRKIRGFDRWVWLPGGVSCLVIRPDRNGRRHRVTEGQQSRPDRVRQCQLHPGLVLHAVDAVGLVHAMILRIQALVLSIQSLVFSGH